MIETETEEPQDLIPTEDRPPEIEAAQDPENLVVVDQRKEDRVLAREAQEHGLRTEAENSFLEKAVGDHVLQKKTKGHDPEKAVEVQGLTKVSGHVDPDRMNEGAIDRMNVRDHAVLRVRDRVKCHLVTRKRREGRL